MTTRLITVCCALYCALLCALLADAVIVLRPILESTTQETS